MQKPFFYPANFSSANSLFWENLNIPINALKQFRICPVKKYYNGSNWVHSSDLSPIYSAVFGNSLTIIQPNHISDKFINYFDKDSFDIFGYDQLGLIRDVLFIVDNEIDAMLLDSCQLSVISINKKNFQSLNYMIEDLKNVTSQIVLVCLKNENKDFFKNIALKYDLDLIDSLSQNPKHTNLYELFLDDFSIETFTEYIYSFVYQSKHKLIDLHSAS